MTGKLRARWFWGISLAMFGGAALVYLTSYLLIGSTFNDLEEQLIRRDLGRYANAIRQESDEVNATAGDYAAWDATWNYAAGNDPAYVCREIHIEAMSRLKIDAVVIADASGKILCAMGCDSLAATPCEPPQSLLSGLAINGPYRALLNHPNEKSHIAGVLVLPDGPVIVASRPILTSQVRGPIHGTLIMIRRLNAAYLSELAARTDISATAQAWSNTFPALHPIQAELVRGQSSVLRNDHDTSVISAYGMIPDVFGQPGLLTEVTHPRSISQQGQKALYVFGGTLMGVTAIFTAIVLGLAMRLHSTRAAGESQLRSAKESAEHANAAKDHFLAILSHELRTPLTPVLLASQELSASPQLPANLRSLAEMIRRNLEMEVHLVDDLLDISRIARGKMNLDPWAVDVHDAIGLAVDLVRNSLHAGELTLQLDLCAQRHHTFADPSRLRQVFWNLLTNAIKFTPPGGCISIRTRIDANEIVADFCDTGLGISEDNLHRLFTPFQQADAIPGRGQQGLGLGLSIAKAIVDRSGGSISVSSPGLYQGSTFTVRLPLVDAPAPVPTPAPPEHRPPAFAKMKILLVEDNADTATLLLRLLKSEGYDAVAAHTYDEAIHAISETTFDLLISDIALPDGNGLDLLRRIRQTTPLPAIAISGFGMDYDIHSSRETGFAAHLTKPVDFQVLAATIQQTLADHRRQTSPPAR